MGQPVEPAAPPRAPVLNVPAGAARSHSAGPLVVRVQDIADVETVAELPPDRVVWVEVPLPLAAAPWPPGAPLDVVVEDPARDAACLYTLTEVCGGRAVRVTIPGRPGLARCARIAIGLQVPVRLMVGQPSPAVLAELDEALEVYLHDPRASAPVEFLHAALAQALHGDAPPLWVAVELDPDWYPHVADDTAWPPREPGFVARRFAELVGAGGECGTCRFRQWCQGFFKWPDPAYHCDGVARFLARIEENASQITRDLAEARALER